MKKLLLFSLLLLLVTNSINGQSTKYYIVLYPNNNNVLPLNDSSIITSDTIVNSILSTNEVYRYEKIDIIPKYWPHEYLPHKLHFEGNADLLQFQLMSTNKFDSVVIREFPKLLCSSTNDNEYGNLDNNGKIISDWNLRMVDAYCAWTITEGDPNIVVACIDAGPMDINHEDLQNKIVSSTYMSPLPYPPSEHGNKVMGLITAESNNGKGIASIGNKTKAAAYQIYTDTWGGDALPGTEQAIKDGHRIINLSWTGGAGETKEKVMQAVLENGVIFICAAGTESNLNSIPHNYYYDVDGVILVTSVDSNNEVIPTTGLHFPYIDIAAPGLDVSTTVSGNGYQETVGLTSAAAPHVSAAVSLLLSINPCLTPTEVEEILKESADTVADWSNLGSGFGGNRKGRRLNVYNALSHLNTYKIYIPSFTEVWSDERRVGVDIIIQSGAQLTITGTLYMGCKNKIIVEPGGRLIIDGGTITTLPYNNEGYWQGIFVEHDTATGLTGFVHIKNGSVIEYARKAVRNHNGSVVNAGGRIWIQNSTIRNCRHGVELIKLAKEPLFPYNNLFENNTFVIDDDYRFDIENPNNDFLCHISAWDLSSINIRDNQFKNLHTGKFKNKGKGIHTYNAGVVVNRIWNGISAGPGNYFEGFDDAIFFDGDVNSKNTSLVNYSSFDRNTVGVHVRNTNNVSVTNSNFSVGNAKGVEIFDCGDNIGIYTENANVFTIDDNTFNEATGKVALYTAGVLIHNSGDNNTDVYRNNFNGLDHGVMASGINGSQSANGKGLVIACNTFENNGTDINVTGNGINPVQAYWDAGVLVDAGNVFNSPDSMHFRNAGYVTDYYYSNPNTEPTNYTGRLNVINTSNVNNCLSRLSTSNLYPISLDNTEYMATSNAYFTIKNSTNCLIDSLQTLLDEGDTDSVLSKIPHWPLGTVTKNTLLAMSPFVSDTVIKATIWQNKIPKYMMTEVLEANPDVLKRSAFQEFLMNPMNPYTYTQTEIDDIPLAFTSRTEIDGRIASKRARQSLLLNNIITDIKAGDTLPINEDSLITWLARNGEMWSEYERAFAVNNTGDTALSRQILDSLSVKFVLSTEDLNDRNNVQIVRNIINSLKYDNRLYDELDSLEMVALNNVIGANYKISASLAAAVMEYSGNRSKICAVVWPGPATFKMAQPFNNNDKKDGISLKVYPNPASRQVHFEMEDVAERTEPISISIYDIRGVLVKQITVHNKQMTYTWSLEGVAAGAYQYKVQSGDAELGNGQIMVVGE